MNRFTQKDNVLIEFVGCHRDPSRSFFWKDKQFPFCARCTGIYLGYISLPFFLLNLIHFNWTWTILLILPTLIDGYIQAFFDVESTNLRRLITGIFNGIGTMSFINIIGNDIGNYIYHHIH